MTSSRKISEIDKAYIAGFFDGEGCVTGQQGWEKKSPARLVISFAQKDPTILHWIQKTLGLGHIIFSRSVCTSALMFSGKEDISRFIQLILPYSKIKRLQLAVALKMTKLIACAGRPVADAIRKQREGLAKEIKKLNKEGNTNYVKNEKLLKTYRHRRGCLQTES